MCSLHKFITSWIFKTHSKKGRYITETLLYWISCSIVKQIWRIKCNTQSNQVEQSEARNPQWQWEMANGERKTTCSRWNGMEDEDESGKLEENWNQIKVQHHLCNENRKKIRDIVPLALCCCRCSWVQHPLLLSGSCPFVAPGPVATEFPRSQQLIHSLFLSLEMTHSVSVSGICCSTISTFGMFAWT